MIAHAFSRVIGHGAGARVTAGGWFATTPDWEVGSDGTSQVYRITNLLDESLEIIGDQLNAYLDDVLQLSATDGEIASARVGLGAEPSSVFGAMPVCARQGLRGQASPR
jgi:hypothetical protein